MSIDAIRPRELQYSDCPDAQTPKPSSESAQKLPDFSSSIFSAVHLPTGLMTASASPTTPGTVTKDLAELQAHVATVSADLRSPELATALKADARVYQSYVFFNACFLPLAKAIFVDQGAAKIANGAVAILALWKGVPAAIDDFKTAHARALDANAKAHPALVKLVHDLAAMQESAIKLAADTKKLGGV